MRKAKYKPWQVLPHQKWILINAVTKWDTPLFCFGHNKKAGRDYIRVFLFILLKARLKQNRTAAKTLRLDM